jgi:hypothetical protein
MTRHHPAARCAKSRPAVSEETGRGANKFMNHHRARNAAAPLTQPSTRTTQSIRFFNALQIRGQGRALHVFFLRATS